MPPPGLELEAPPRQASLEDYEDGAPPESPWRPFAVTEEGHVAHPGVAPGAVGARAYQLNLARRALEESVLVVLPTGLGKTVVAVLAAADALHRGEGRVVVVAPTRPLVEQHRATFAKMLADPRGLVAVTGHTPPTARAELVAGARVVFSTPQGLRNDVEAGRASLQDVALLVVDEAHRAVGKYAYVPLARMLHEQNPSARVLGLTASPGGRGRRIRRVVENLAGGRKTEEGTPARVAVEARTESSRDVAPHVHGVHVEWHETHLPGEMVEMRDLLQDVLREKVRALQSIGFLTWLKGPASKTAVIKAGDAIRARLARGRRGYLFGAIHHQTIAVHAQHCLELLETQGCRPLEDYLDRLAAREKPKRAERAFLNDERVAEVRRLLQFTGDRSHPKTELMVDVVREHLAANPGGRAIVFAQYRDTICDLKGRLADAGLTAERFVGQADREGDPGLRQDAQHALLQRFRRGEVDVLVASSVGEEGIDVPRVELVVFYEPVPSEIRTIQRRGRAGRTETGRCAVLVTKGTRDEASLRAALGREALMQRTVARMAAEG